jgi:aminoglycoside phosphotransferase (APT) family kinase protein
MDQLDIEQTDTLIRYLRQQGHIAPDEEPVCRVLSGGVSNRAVWVARPSGEQWVLKQALAKLRVPVDWFSSPTRIHREALGLRYLAELAPPGSVPGLVFEDEHNHILAMQAVPQPHANWKQLLLQGRLEPAHVAQFGALLGGIHRAAFERRAGLEPLFADRSFFETLRLEPYYRFTAAQAPPAAGFLHALIQETLTRSLTLVHGDYSPKNILLYQGRMLLLDHEVIHWGDPAFDLGFALAHLLSKAHHLAVRRADFGDAARHYWRVYRETIGQPAWAADLEPWVVRHTLGCLLARVAGRSALEYLDAAERARQRSAVLDLMAAPPETLDGLIDDFLANLSRPD